MSEQQAIYVNGEELFIGGSTIGVIFNNLTGENFLKPLSWQRLGSYEEYLASLESMTGVQLEKGAVVEWRDEQGAVVATHRLLEDLPGSFVRGDGTVQTLELSA
jgi:hypothetical protein